MKESRYFNKILLKNLNEKTALISEELTDLRSISFKQKKHAEEAIGATSLTACGSNVSLF